MASLQKVADLRPHPTLGGDALLPPLSSDEYEALKASIRQDGIQQPLLVGLPEKIIIDGHHRWRAAEELGLSEVPVITEETRSDEARTLLGLTLNIARRQLSSEQKRIAVAALLKEDPKQSDRAVARVAGVSHPTVASVRAELEQAGDVEKSSTRTDSAGREQPATKPSQPKSPSPSLKRSVAAEPPPPEPEEAVEPEVDPVAEWEAAQKEVERLEDLVETLQEGDAKKELAELSRKYGQLEGRVRQLTTEASEAKTQAKRNADLLRKIAAKLGVERWRDILPALEDLLR